MSFFNASWICLISPGHGTIEHIRFTGQADKAESLEQELSENSLRA
jgi:hypothetical protein